MCSRRMDIYRLLTNYLCWPLTCVWPFIEHCCILSPVSSRANLRSWRDSRFISWGCCSKWPQTWWLKFTFSQFWKPAVGNLPGPCSVWGLWERICPLPPRAPGGCQHSQAAAFALPAHTAFLWVCNFPQPLSYKNIVIGFRAHWDNPE